MIKDFRFAFRQLWKSPGFTIAAVAVLALGIGVNTAIFSLVNVMVFQPPAYQRPAEIVQLFSQDKKDPKNFRAFSYPTYCDIRDQNTVFSGLLAHDDTVVGIGEKGNVRRAVVDIVSSNYFSVLGVSPAYGRAFLPEEEKPGAGVRVAVVSYSYWQKHSRDPSVLGRALLINGRAFTIVGIMPEGFTGTESVFSREAWLPLGVYDEIMSDRGGARNRSLTDRGSDRLMVIGRLKPGVTAEAAQPALKGLAANLEAAFPVEQKDQTLMTAPLNRFATSTDSGRKRPGPDDRRLAGRNGGRGPARRLFESGEHAARARHRAAQRNRDPSGARREPRPHRPATSHRRLRPRAARRGLRIAPRPLVFRSARRLAQQDFADGCRLVERTQSDDPGRDAGLLRSGHNLFCARARAQAFARGRHRGFETTSRRRRAPAALEISPAQSARRGADRFLPGAGHGRRAFHSRRRESGFGRNGIPGRGTLSSWKSMRASAASIRSARRIFTASSAKNSRRFPGVEHAGISATVPFGINTVRRTVLRAGLTPAPDDKAGHRGGGTNLHSVLEQRRRGLFRGGGTAVASRPRFHRGRSDPARRTGGRHHRRSPGEKIVAGR